jgi:hypothetical protein
LNETSTNPQESTKGLSSGFYEISTVAKSRRKKRLRGRKAKSSG